MSFERFKILLWKNWIISKRNPKAGLFEILLPVALVLLMTWIKTLFDPLYFILFAAAALPIFFVFCMFYSVNNTIKVSIKWEMRTFYKYGFF